MYAFSSANIVNVYVAVVGARKNPVYKKLKGVKLPVLVKLSTPWIMPALRTVVSTGVFPANHCESRSASPAYFFLDRPIVDVFVIEISSILTMHYFNKLAFHMLVMDI
jgi:hypothetical protein